MRPTRAGFLAVIALGVAVLAFAALRVVDARMTTLPRLPVSAPTAVLGLALVVGMATLALRPRLLARPGARTAGGPKPLHPLVAARVAVLAKASAHVGAVLLGVYVGYLLVLPGLDADLRRDRAIVAGLSALGGLLLASLGLLLERACRVPPPADDDEPPPAVPTP